MPYALVHVLVGKKFNKSKWHSLGCLFPDVTHLLVKDKKHNLMKSFIKLLDKNIYSDFIDGIKTHVALDNYLHKNYIYPKRDVLVKEFNLSDSTAEGYVEIALDFLYEKSNPEVLSEITECAELLDIDEMTEKLSKIIPKNKETIRRALKTSKNIALSKNLYGIRSAILNSVSLRKYKRLKVQEFNPLKSFFILRRAKQLIMKDHEKEISKAIIKVKTLRNNPWSD